MPEFPSDRIPVVSAYAAVAASEATSSGSYVDLATVGPSVTINVPASGNVLITLGCYIIASTGQWAEWTVVASGANTITAATVAANGGSIVKKGGATAQDEIELSRTFELTGLAPGATTFKAQYKVSGGGTGTYARRTIFAMALP